MQIQTTTIKFPEIKLATRDAHKLRGYFGNLFKEHSPLLHNHLENNKFSYNYPQVQYKVIDGVPLLFGFSQGAELLVQLFLKIKELQIDAKTYPVLTKNIETKIQETGTTNDFHTYEFKTLWLGLNQKNYKQYRSMDESRNKYKLLQKILTSNILSFYKGVELYDTKKIELTCNLSEKATRFKNEKMLAFSGQFTVNALLPDLIGLGKSVSRGFGAIIKVK